MSARATRRIVWLTLLVVAPLPMVMFGAWIPVTRYLLLAGVCVVVRLAEGPGGVVWQLTGLFALHALVYAVLLWLVAWAVARALGVLPSPPRTALLGAGVAVALAWGLLAEPYVTPFGTSARSNLVGTLR